MANKRISQARLRPLLETAPHSLADTVSLQALAQGTADRDQQLRALKWIMYNACGFNDIIYRETDRDTAFAEGKRFVAQQINVLLTTNTRNIND